MTKLSYQARKSMNKKSFVFPSKKNENNPAGKGAYPIPDIKHARNALARVSQFGTSEEKKTVRAKVHAKFPSVGEKTKYTNDYMHTDKTSAKGAVSNEWKDYFDR